ncbi:hypothetical protein ES702_02500 [subsurface metagenome]
MILLYVFWLILFPLLVLATHLDAYDEKRRRKRH